MAQASGCDLKPWEVELLRPAEFELIRASADNLSAQHPDQGQGR
jgi:hypothetical protein